MSSDEADFSQEYFVYFKKNRQSMAAKDSSSGVLKDFKEGLIKSARADCGKILRQNAAQFRRNTLCISRNCNKIMPQNFRKAPKTHLVSASLNRLLATASYATEKVNGLKL